MRLAIIGVVLCCPLLFFVPQNDKPTLYIVESDSCGPCRKFQDDWTNLPGFANRLRSAFDVRGLHWETPEQQSLARRLGVSSLPSFVVVTRNGRHLGMIVGYTHANVLLQELRLTPLQHTISQPRHVAPSQSTPSRDPAITPRVVSEDQRPRPAQSTADEAARREIQRLEQTMQSLQRQLRDVGKPPESSQELQSLRRTVEELKAAAANAAESQHQDQLPVTPILTPDATRGEPSGLLALAIKAGTTLLLPEVAIPAGALSIAATVGGWWLGRRRRRLPEQWAPSAAASGLEQNSVTVLRDSTTRQNTANHYVVKETDKVGEAYKEAIRRITAAYKSDKPGIVDVASQIEHVAQEILRGQTVTARASNAPRPGLWTDED
jgi:prefoldin subunit 5